MPGSTNQTPHNFSFLTFQALGRLKPGTLATLEHLWTTQRNIKSSYQARLEPCFAKVGHITPWSWTNPLH